MKCGICKHTLSDDYNSLRYDCGGDCRLCMALVGGDPDCLESVATIAVNHLRTINDIIFSYGAPLGSKKYFEIRKLVNEASA